MKKLNLFLAGIVLTLSAEAQILKEKTILLPDSSTLSYLTNQDKISGLYTITKKKNELARGNYVDNKRVGNWYFFNNDKSIFLRYNYDTKKILFLDEKTLALAEIVVKAPDNEIAKKATASIPMFSLEQYVLLAAKASSKAIPDDDKLRLKNKEIALIASITKDGTAKYVAQYEIKGEKIDRVLSLGGIKIDWLPSSFEGQNYDSEFIIKTPIAFDSKDEGLHRRFNWL